jgi:hypothetical protein
LLGRVKRGEPPRPTQGSRERRLRQALLTLSAGAVAAAAVLWLPDRQVTVDRCCYDFDGGGKPDDGVRVTARRDGRVSHLSIYEDIDGSGDHTPADLVRLDRNRLSNFVEETPPGLTNIRHCCEDFDGGGPPDDGIVVVGTPPDRVVSATLYELR